MCSGEPATQPSPSPARLPERPQTPLPTPTFTPPTRFREGFDVEILARIGRVFDLDGVQNDPAALDIAENVLKVGAGPAVLMIFARTVRHPPAPTPLQQHPRRA